MQKGQRYSYIDNIKLAACILVALGHFFMSMTANSVIPYSDTYNYLLDTLYTFHVPLFFVCSGFLYQKVNRVNSFKAYTKELPKKLLDLGVPYFVFTGITLGLKMLFENDVTSKATGFFETMFINPTAPYWYLYVLFMMFLLIPCMKSKRSAIALFLVAVILKTICVYAYSNTELLNGFYEKLSSGFLVFIIQKALSFSNSAIWFCGGILLAFLNGEKLKTLGKFLSPVFLAGAVAMSIFAFSSDSDINETEKFITGLLFVVFCIVTAIVFSPERLNRISLKLSDLFMPVFVMHTISAAAIRILLFKIGITSFIPHLIGGLIGSFIVPAVVYMICKKLTPLMFFFYPTKTIKLLKEKGNGKG